MRPPLLIASCLVFALAGCGDASADRSESSAAADTPRNDIASQVDERLADADGAFAMQAQDVFSITGRGIVVTGIVASGAVSVGDTVCVGASAPVTVKGIEMFKKLLDRAAAGDRVGLLFDELTKTDIEKGDQIRSCD